MRIKIKKFISNINIFNLFKVSGNIFDVYKLFILSIIFLIIFCSFLLLLSIRTFLAIKLNTPFDSKKVSNKFFRKMLVFSIKFDIFFEIFHVFLI